MIIININDQFYTVKQVAKMLNRHPQTIRRLVKEGKLVVYTMRDMHPSDG